MRTQAETILEGSSPFKKFIIILVGTISKCQQKYYYDKWIFYQRYALKISRDIETFNRAIENTNTDDSILAHSINKKALLFEILR